MLQCVLGVPHCHGRRTRASWHVMPCHAMPCFAMLTCGVHHSEHCSACHVTRAGRGRGEIWAGCDKGPNKPGAALCAGALRMAAVANSHCKQCRCAGECGGTWLSQCDSERWRSGCRHSTETAWERRVLFSDALPAVVSTEASVREAVPLHCAVCGYMLCCACMIERVVFASDSFLLAGGFTVWPPA